MRVQFKRLYPGARLPEYKTAGAAGADVYCPDTYYLPARARVIAFLGFAIKVPDGYEMQIRPRSSLALNHGVTVLNSPSTIDSDYVGEIGVVLVNHSNESVQIYAGDRIAQFVLQPVHRAEFEVVDELPLTDRGQGGFGSTGR